MKANITQQGRRGVAIVEAAITLSLFLLLFLGAIEIGRVWMNYNLLDHAVREAARMAVVRPISESPLAVHRLDELLHDAGVTATSRSVTFGSGLVTVRAQVNFVPVTSLIFGGLTVPLRAQVTTHYELGS